MHLPSTLPLSLLLTTLLSPLVLSSPTPAQPLTPRQQKSNIPNGAGIHEASGWYYYFWSDGGATTRYTNGPEGSYEVEWNGAGNWFGGKGWGGAEAGVARNVSYTANLTGTGNHYLSLYGMTRTGASVRDFYILEASGTYNPISAASSIGSQFRLLGRFTTRSGDIYELAVQNHIRMIPIDMPLHQTLYSVRVGRTGGKGVGELKGRVDTGEHFEAWRGLGLQLGSMEFMVLAVEGYHSSGRAKVEVFDG